MTPEFVKTKKMSEICRKIIFSNNATLSCSWNEVLGDRFPRKNSRQHNSIYNVLLVTDTIQVCSIINSIVSFQSGSALY